MSLRNDLKPDQTSEISTGPTQLTKENYSETRNLKRKRMKDTFMEDNKTFVIELIKSEGHLEFHRHRGFTLKIQKKYKSPVVYWKYPTVKNMDYKRGHLKPE